MSNDNHISDDTFLENYHLLTKDGHFNYLAELLVDKNDIVINVATFASSDKTKYLRREEFGGKCLLLVVEQAKNYVNSINQTFVDVTTTPRKERKMLILRRLNKRGLTHVCITNGAKAIIRVYTFIVIA